MYYMKSYDNNFYLVNWVKFLSHFPSEASTKFQEPRPVTLIDLLVSVFFFMRKFKSVAAKKM